MGGSTAVCSLGPVDEAGGIGKAQSLGVRRGGRWKLEWIRRWALCQKRIDDKATGRLVFSDFSRAAAVSSCAQGRQARLIDRFGGFQRGNGNEGGGAVGGNRRRDCRHGGVSDERTKEKELSAALPRMAGNLPNFFEKLSVQGGKGR